MRRSHCVAFALLCAASAAAADPALETLWPNADGFQWNYQISVTVDPAGTFTAPAVLQLSGQAETAGGTAQVLLASHPVPPAKTGAASSDPLLARLWSARPDLRTAIAARYGAQEVQGTSGWYPLLLHGGYFMKTAAAIQMWQPSWTHPTWTYLTSNLTVGAQFTHQLVPELADNVFLHGTVEALDATVQTGAGIFGSAVRMGYVIDYGWAPFVDDTGMPHGRLRAETRGRVHFVPGVGPVEMLEDFIEVAEFECDMTGCPPAGVTDHLGESLQTIELSLSSSTVPVQERTWGEVKALFRH